jgi:Zn-dependent peptidase ImmA (M78 family)
MIEDFIVPPRSCASIEQCALAWRDALGVSDAWAPDIVSLIENELPRFFSTFALVVRPDSEMEDAEAYTQFDPPQIVVRESVYREANKRHGRSRMTLSHELGHLVMHAGVRAKPRMIGGNKSAPSEKIYESAEWQAREFASAFLMPDHIVRQFDSFEQLQECCQVSRLAAEIRFGKVGHKKPRILAASVREAIDRINSSPHDGWTR